MGTSIYMEWLRISRILGIPYTWLEWPEVIFYIISPFILMTYAIYSILERLGIFGRNRNMNIVLGAVISFMSLPLGSLTATGSIFIISTLKIRGTKGIVIGILGGITYWIILPWILNL